jgi:hypothetical protein
MLSHAVARHAKAFIGSGIAKNLVYLTARARYRLPEKTPKLAACEAER